MYKAFQNKKYYLAFETFNNYRRKNIKVYRTGIRNWISDDMYTYSIVIYKFRIMFGIKRNDIGTCNGD